MTTRAVRCGRRDRRQARRRPDSRRAAGLGDRRLHARRGRRRADGRPGHGDPAQRHGARRAGPLDGGDDRVGRAARSVRRVPPDDGQALDRRRRRQDHAAAGAAGRRVWRRRSAAVRAEDWATPAALWTSWNRSRAGGPSCPTPSSWPSCDDVGAVVCAAGDELAPADRKLYALRDVTGTVESIPLIASSIMSKKIAEGSAALVLDVKVGSGAFMKTVEDARELAAHDGRAWAPRTGTRTVALLTDMSTPLGRTAGNALEVAESVEVLAGGGPTGRRGADPGAGPGDARRRRPGGRRPGRRTARRPGDGRVAAR